jgi:hypothetical protein
LIVSRLDYRVYYAKTILLPFPSLLFINSIFILLSYSASPIS